PPPPECDFNRDGKVDQFEAEECKKQMPPPGDMTGPMGPPPPECDFNRDGKVDQFEAEQCKKQMPPPGDMTGPMGPPPPECDFNRDGKVDQFEAEECKKQMPPPGDTAGPMGPPPPDCDLNRDGMVDRFEAEQCGKMAPPPGDMAGPPPCSDELRQAEQMPQAEGVGCRERAGNLIFRTICNLPGFDMAAISLPEGRAASCFGVESIREHIEFEIVTEAGDLVWEPGMGKEAFMGLKLGPGVYHIRSRGGSPEGAVTVRFVDVPTM
ncbi:MAG: hypothetical protein ABIL09_07450, partial [Gemmatimonadota bacterium]